MAFLDGICHCQICRYLHTFYHQTVCLVKKSFSFSTPFVAANDADDAVVDEKNGDDDDAVVAVKNGSIVLFISYHCHLSRVLYPARGFTIHRIKTAYHIVRHLIISCAEKFDLDSHFIGGILRAIIYLPLLKENNQRNKLECSESNDYAVHCALHSINIAHFWKILFRDWLWWF